MRQVFLLDFPLLRMYTKPVAAPVFFEDFCFFGGAKCSQLDIMDISEKKRYHKTVIVNRAVSGSEKTTLSRCVTEALRAHGLTVSVHPTDEISMKDDRYCFDINGLNESRIRNLANFTSDLERGIDVVICDNMNLLPWQSQPYTDAARQYQYRVLFLNFLPRELEKHPAAQAVAEEKPDASGLSGESWERFIRFFNDYNDLLDRNTPRDIKRHHKFVWNDIDKAAMDTGELAPYFDADAVITIRPDKYQEMKNNLADIVLDIVEKPDEELDRGAASKHYLLTWYGITDMRAALGFEPSEGPVAGALRTGKYTDVIVLGYTNPDKPQDAFSGAIRKEWEILHALPSKDRQAYPREKAQLIVDAVCNTGTGHAIFQEHLQSANLPVNIRFVPQVLSHLNDARGIELAARKALQLALADEAEKDITCFLSPGTPVMAYTWATVSRANPNLRIRVIASSDPRNPPEEIDLPKDVMSPSVDAKSKILPASFDVIIHLLGTDTNIPQYFSIVHLPAPRHWFITSAESDKTKALRRLLPGGGTMETKIVDAFVPAHTQNAIESIVRSLPPTATIGINLTGGTKLMFAGGLNACNEFPNTEPFYFDIKQHNITFIRTGKSVRFKGVFSIDGFFTASGYDIITEGYWEDNPVREARKELTSKLWEKRDLIRNLYQSKEYRAYNPPYGKPNPPFRFSASRISATLEGDHASLVMDGESLQVPDCTDFGTYIGGGWLEEYVYLQLLPLMDAGQIHDLRTGVEIFPAGQPPRDGQMPCAEFDCAFTDGNRLFIVECKTCPITQAHIQKLENNLKSYGGITARGMLISIHPLPQELKPRISRSPSIRVVPPENNFTQGLCSTILS